MPTDTLIPYFDDDSHVTATASGAITGKTFVGISGNLASDNTFTVAKCAAGARAFGVAEYDAASGAWLGVVRRGIVPVTCGAANLVAGVQVEVDANGEAIVWGGTIATQPVGMCLTAANAGTDAMIALYR